MSSIYFIFYNLLNSFFKILSGVPIALLKTLKINTKERNETQGTAETRALPFHSGL